MISWPSSWPGSKEPIVGLLGSSPPLAARFPVVIDFPGYTPGQARRDLRHPGRRGWVGASTPAAERKAAAVLARAVGGHGPNARLAVQLLDQATANHARRITRPAPAPPDPGAVNTMTEATHIPGHLQPRDQHSDDQRPGQYL